MARTGGGLVALGVVALVAAGAVTELSAAPLRANALTVATPISFGVPTVVDPIHTNGEPDIAINPKDGSVYNSGPTGTGTQRSTWFASIDQGQTFRPVNQLVPPSSVLTTVAPQPGGGDTDINFARSGTQYFADLYALACLRVAVTNDDGASTSQNIIPGGCAGKPAADRQWLAVYDPATRTAVANGGSAYTGTTPLVYMEYNNLGTGTEGTGLSQWTKSTDGLTYSSASKGGEVGADGYPAIDQVTGKVFEAVGVAPTDGAAQALACPAPKTHCLVLNIGTPDATGNLTFRDEQTTPALIHIADTPAGDPDSLFTVASMDSARNLYVTYAINPDNSDPALRQVYVTAAGPDTGWTVWTPPVRVSGMLGNDKVDVFPWGKAGGPGRMDAVWYGADKLEDPSAHSTPPKAWNVFMSQVVFATDPTKGNAVITGQAPQIVPSQATPHPMHYDDICLQGTACIASAGNRNLADFFVVTLDAKGAAQIVYDDTSNGLIQQPQACSVTTQVQTQVIDHCGAGVITVAHQSGGPSALDGSDVAATFTGTTSPPISGLTRSGGHALYPVIGGTNVPAMDLLSTHMSLSGSTLTVTTTVAGDPRTGVAALIAAGDVTRLLHFVTRWQLGNTIYYGAMQVNATGTTQFYAGRAQSIDLCSVSACFPHVITYPEPGTAAANPGSGFTEPGTLSCPVAPATGPCTITINIKVADVGGPNSGSLLEEVGTYALSSSHRQGTTTTAQAQADNVPLEIDGICCYNFGVSPTGGPVPEAPLVALLPLVGVALIGAGVVRRRRHRMAS